MSGKSCGCKVCKAVGILLAVGGINWGLVGLLQVDAVARIFGYMTPAARAVYILVGAAGVLKVLSFFKACPCSSKGTCEEKK